MRTSAEIDKIATAIAAVQQACPFVDKTNEADIGKDFKYKFAPHDLVAAKLYPLCTQHGIAIMQGGREGAGASHWLVTRLVHNASGQWVEGDVKVEPGKSGMTALGAVWSYARRIGLMGLLGVVAKGEDSDAGDDHAGRTAAPRVSKAARPAGTSPDSAKGWEDALVALGDLRTMDAVDELSGETKAKYGLPPKDMHGRVQKGFADARARIAAAVPK